MDGISFKLNGHATRDFRSFVNKSIARAMSASDYWCSAEYNSNNAWNIRGDGNFNNNNKYNSFRVRAVAALDEKEKVSILEAYDDCCRNKKGSSQCVQFRVRPEQLLGLALTIKERNYKPIVSETFVVSKPKKREIFAASFVDRIVQHWIYLRINPLFEERFRKVGDVSFNCRKNYGTLAARQRVYDDMHHFGFADEMFVGKFDIHSFFMSIDLRILWDLLRQFIIEQYKGDDIDTLLYLTEITVMHRPQNDCIKKGNLGLWDDIPPSKSLFHKGDYKGMAIGNITSQIMCNFYMSFYDNWLLDRIRELGYEEPNRHYTRFVDDFVIHSMRKEHIVQLFKESTVWLRDHLELELHQDKVYIQPQRHGVKFVGGVIMPGRMYIINRTVGAYFVMLNNTERLCRDLVLFGPDADKLKKLQHYVSSLNSYGGFMVHGRTYNLQKKALSDKHYFWKVLYTTKNLTVVKIRKKYKLTKFLNHGEELLKREAAALYKRRWKRAYSHNQFRNRRTSRR